MAVLANEGGLQKVLRVRGVEELHTQSVIHHHSCLSSCLVCTPDCSPCTESTPLRVSESESLLGSPGTSLMWRRSVASDAVPRSREDEKREDFFSSVA